MGVFDDKKFQELDWISQATEPMDSRMNEALSLLPDELLIDFNTYKEIVGEYHMDLTYRGILGYLLTKHADKLNISWHQREALERCFSLEMIGEDVQLDFEKQLITGEIKFTKTVSTMDEKVLENMLGVEGIEAATTMFIPQNAFSRANEIMELLGKCEDGLKTRSERKKRICMKKRLEKLFKANEWKIKDTELANKVGYWIRDYIKDGNMAAFSNFCRLKVMTHKEQPIYSMEEVK